MEFIMNKYARGLSVLIFLLFLGCLPTKDKLGTNFPPISTNSPEVPNTQVQKPTETATLTLLPILSVTDSQNELISLLHSNGDCSFPCFWEFIPGETKMGSYSSFRNRFEKISSGLRLVLQRDDLQLSVEATAQGGYKGDPDIVKWFDVNMAAFQKKGAEEKKVYGNPDYSEVFQYYSLQNLLSKYGLPDQVYVVLDTGLSDMGLGEDLYLLSIEYPNDGWMAVFEMPLQQKEASFWGCPSDALVNLRFWSPADKPSGAFYGGFGGTDKSYLFTIEEATGMTVEEFYQKFKDPANTTCLETPSDIHK
jgi:hypothetical protein